MVIMISFCLFWHVLDTIFCIRHNPGGGYGHKIKEITRYALLLEQFYVCKKCRQISNGVNPTHFHPFFSPTALNHTLSIQPWPVFLILTILDMSRKKQPSARQAPEKSCAAK